jgi:hypothetical protein
MLTVTPSLLGADKLAGNFFFGFLFLRHIGQNPLGPRRSQSGVFDERKSGLTNRLNFSGSAFSSSRLKASSLARVFSLIGFGGFDFLIRGTLKPGALRSLLR